MISSSYDYFAVRMPDAPYSVARIPRGEMPHTNGEGYEVIASCVSEEVEGTIVRALNAFASMQRTVELITVEPHAFLSRQEVEKLLEDVNNREDDG